MMKKENFKESQEQLLQSLNTGKLHCKIHLFLQWGIMKFYKKLSFHLSRQALKMLLKFGKSNIFQKVAQQPDSEISA